MSAVETLVTALERGSGEHDALSVEANLRVAVGDTAIAVTGSGERVHIGVPSLWAGLSLAVSRLETVRALARALALAELTAEVRVGHAVVAILGSDARPSLLAKTLSVGPVEIRGRGLVAAALHIR